jgi:hypothetical protein
MYIFYIKKITQFILETKVMQATNASQ